MSTPHDNRTTGLKKPPGCDRTSAAEPHAAPAARSSAQSNGAPFARNGSGNGPAAAADLPGPPVGFVHSDGSSPRHDWRTRAACRGVDINIFYPPEDDDQCYSKEAIALCARCPVRDECLMNALSGADGTNKLSYGYWGGTTPEERLAMIDALPKMPRPCAVCGTNMPEDRSATAKYCSLACKRRARRSRANSRWAPYIA